MPKSNDDLEVDIGDLQTFPNVAVVSIVGRGWQLVYLGRPTWDAVYTVTQKNNGQTREGWGSVMTAGTTTTLIVDGTKEFYKELSLISTEVQKGNSAAGQVKIASNLQPRCSVNTIVHDVTTGEWGMITSFATATTANVSNFTLAHNNGNILEFYVPLIGAHFYNQPRNTHPYVPAFSFATPDRVTVAPAVTGQVAGDAFQFSPGFASWQWDEAGFCVTKPGPVPGSNPPGFTGINIFNKSLMTMEFIVSWR